MALTSITDCFANMLCNGMPHSSFSHAGARLGGMLLPLETHGATVSSRNEIVEGGAFNCVVLLNKTLLSGVQFFTARCFEDDLTFEVLDPMTGNRPFQIFA